MEGPRSSVSDSPACSINQTEPLEGTIMASMTMTITEFRRQRQLPDLYALGSHGCEAETRDPKAYRSSGQSSHG